VTTEANPHGNSVRFRCLLCRNGTSFWEDEVERALAAGRKKPVEGSLGELHEWLILSYPPPNPKGYAQGKCRKCRRITR
jgi:hypothetical protein